MRALIVEDEQPWCKLLSYALRTIPGMEVDCVDDADRAWEALLGRDDYALVTVDISLVAYVMGDAVVNRKGFDLLRRMRSADYPPDPALLIVSGYPTEDHIRDAFAEYKVDDFISKSGFNGAAFARRARSAILTAVIRAAEYRVHHRPEVTISVKEDRFILAQLNSPGRKATYEPLGTPFDAAAFASRADELNVRSVGGDGSWRQSARALGEELYRVLMGDPSVGAAMMLGSELSSRHDPAVIQFNGDGAVLGVPFELLTDGNDHLCFEHIIVRRLTLEGPPTKKGEAFHNFLDGVARSGEPLRVLLVASDSDGSIPLVDAEVIAVRNHLANVLDALGVRVAFDVLLTADATYHAVTQRLKSGQHHLLHYAGHGRFDDKLPEISELVLSDGARLRAHELKQLVHSSALRLVFLSCCVGARSAQDIGRGDFHGTIEALVRGGTPIALGYRWVVSDDGARAFAVTFYEELFRTLSPGLALLRTRVSATDAVIGGRNNSTWASPVMVCQTSP
jgi:DNA-binding response OmpR family regulator